MLNLVIKWKLILQFCEIFEVLDNATLKIMKSKIK